MINLAMESVKIANMSLVIQPCGLRSSPLTITISHMYEHITWTISPHGPHVWRSSFKTHHPGPIFLVLSRGHVWKRLISERAPLNPNHDDIYQSHESVPLCDFVEPLCLLYFDLGLNKSLSRCIAWLEIWSNTCQTQRMSFSMRTNTSKWISFQSLHAHSCLCII